MGLSLRLHTSSASQQEEEKKENHKEEEKNNKEEKLMASFGSSVQHNKIPRTHHHDLPAAFNNAHIAPSPPNRKARVSVRARCESATVSVFNYIH